jgi:hypothetical protein
MQRVLVERACLCTVFRRCCACLYLTVRAVWLGAGVVSSWASTRMACGAALPLCCSSLHVVLGESAVPTLFFFSLSVVVLINRFDCRTPVCTQGTNQQLSHQPYATI